MHFNIGHYLIPCLSLCLTVAHAAEPTARGSSDVQIHAVLVGSGVASTAQGKTSAIAEQIWLQGDRARIDFDGGKQQRGTLLKQSDRTWLLLDGYKQALPVSHLALGSITRLNPERPCLSLGISCEHMPDRLIGNRHSSGWRYTRAGYAGPNHTDSGIFWIDTESGVLLGFKGSDTYGRDYQMETTSVQYGPISDDVFRPSGTATTSSM